MCGSRGGIGGPDSRGISIEISIWTPPPWEKVGPPGNVGPPLEPWKSIVFVRNKP